MRSSYHKWSTTELQYIKDNHAILSDDELALNISRISGNDQITAPMIRRQRRKLSLKKSRGRKPKNRNFVQDSIVSAGIQASS